MAIRTIFTSRRRRCIAATADVMSAPSTQIIEENEAKQRAMARKVYIRDKHGANNDNSK
jgi:hypothetical protein